jgi:hypothetical protein
MDDSDATPFIPGARRRFCRLHGPGLAAPLTAVLVEATAQRVGLYLPAAPPRGPTLWLEPAVGPARAVPVRVVRAARDGARGFLAGCAFTRPITDGELAALLGG